MNVRWKVVCVELSEALGELHCEPPYCGIRAVFLWKGIPLGHGWLSEAQLPLTPAQLANVAAKAIATGIGDRLVDEGFRSATPGLPEPAVQDPAGALAALLAIQSPVSELEQRTDRKHSGSGDRASSRLPITVAVCTRERPEDLSRCLSSLAASRVRPHETIVVDNAPATAATRFVVDRFPGVRYHCERRKGLSEARNAALDNATGEIVAFVDDDVVVPPDWLEHIHPCFDDPKVMVATGLILPWELDTPAQLIFEQSFQYFHQGFRRRSFDAAYFEALRDKGVPVWSIGAGANMAIRKCVFDQGARFDTRLGPGSFGGCGEDSEFWYGVLSRGGTCVYEPAAYVFHRHRRDLAALRSLVYQYMKGHVGALILQFMKYGDAGNLRRLFLQLPFEYLILFLRLIVSGFSLDYRIQLRGALGCLSGLSFAFSRRREESPVR